MPCLTLFAITVWNALTVWHCWAGDERWERFVSLVFIHEFSLSTDHDCV